MKKFLSILLVFLFMFQSQAQDSLQHVFDEIGVEIEKELTREELPILNQKILHYTDSVKNTKVGKGLCRHFVNKAIIYATGEKFKETRKLDLAGVYAFEGYNLPRKYALPGDIVYLSLHVGIVYKLYDNGCCIIMAHQNGIKGSPVIIEDYCLRWEPAIKYIRLIPLVRKRPTTPCDRGMDYRYKGIFY